LGFKRQNPTTFYLQTKVKRKIVQLRSRRSPRHRINYKAGICRPQGIGATLLAI